MNLATVDQLPAELVSHVIEGCGEAGKLWLRDLPQTMATLEKHWSIRVEPAFPGVEYNFVAPARTTAGHDVVLKIAPPWDPVEIFGEAGFLKRRAGNRCVGLIGVHEQHKAILIERILPGEALFKTFEGCPGDAIAPAIEVLQSVIGPVPLGARTPVTLDKWFDGLRRHAESDFPHDYAEKALRLYDKLSIRPGGELYLHGDYHPGNVVTSSEHGFVAIDPKGISGHIGYEISVFLNNMNWWQERSSDVRELLDGAVLAFSLAFGISEIELREWAFAGMVLGAWWNFEDMPRLYDGSVVKADVWGV